MTTRRVLLILLGASASAPRAVFAQPKQAPVMIGWLNAGSRKASMHRLAAFKEGMAALGWKENASYVLEERWADSRPDRLDALARELAARKPAVIVTVPSGASAAAAKGAARIPIVQANGADPVAAGLAKSLARPGGMVTGVTNVSTDLTEKYLELLLAAAPGLKRIGFLADPTGAAYAAGMMAAQRSAGKHSIEARFDEARNPEQIDMAIARLAKHGAQALVIVPGNIFFSERSRVAKLAVAQRWPMIASVADFAEAGALLTYGPDNLANFRRAAWYVDRILKGAKPGDLPIERPTKFELVINLKTAKAIGLAIPQDLLFRADRVIE